MLDGLNNKDLDRIFYQRLNFNLEKSLFKAFTKGILKFLQLKFTVRRITNSDHTKSDLLIIIGSKNQYQVLKSIIDNNKYSNIIANNSYGAILPNWTNIIYPSQFPRNLFKRKITYLLNHPFIIRDLYYFIYAESIIDNIIRFLESNSIKRMVFANDHSLINSFFIVASRKCKIKTFYIQHGMVKDNFPPLEYSYFFSYGKFSTEAYERIKNTRIIEVGRNYPIEKSKKTIYNSEFIGLSITELDCSKKIKKVIERLNNDYPLYKIIIRPHPAMKLAKVFKNLIIDNSNLEEYFGKIGFHVSGVSSIHLDSIYYKTPTFLVDILGNNKYDDWYGFEQNKLLPTYEEINDHINYWKYEIAELYIKNVHTKKNPSLEIQRHLNG
jgi:hypothetical protein